MSLADLKAGQSAQVTSVGGEDAFRSHLLDMGITPGTRVSMVRKAPLGDPVELEVRGYMLSLRLAEASRITVSDVCAAARTKRPGPDENRLRNAVQHPGLGEGGHYHHHEDDARELGPDVTLTFALAGQQNSGKTALFNSLTGSNMHVGNNPGLTVERVDSPLKGYPGAVVTDLPGICSLSPYTDEELLSREFILSQKPRGIINVVDATNIERNLYLTVQLMELGIPMVLALNMMDEFRGSGGAVLVNEMERRLGIPVVPVSAVHDEGIDELVEHALHVARYQEAPLVNDFCSKDDHGGAVHRCIHAIRHLVEAKADAAGIPSHFAASKLAEGDALILNALQLSDTEKDMVEAIVSQMEQERGMDRTAAIADMRFNFIEKLCEKTVVRPIESRERRISRRIDRVLTGRWTAIPIFAAIMSLVIWLSIDVIGAPLQEMLGNAIDWLGESVDGLLESVGVHPTIRSLVLDGVFSGVGSVLSFVPIILILFCLLSMLEDSGYMSRVAFVTDKALRKIGLSGRSIVPLLVGFGCSVPAIMSARTLPSARDRRRTILLIPFMSCSAKIPVYAFLTSAFFPGRGGLVLVCLYLTGILTGVLVALCMRVLGRRSRPAPFVMELPNYRMPLASNVLRLLWDKTKDFLQMAFTVIFLASIVIWFLQSFDFRFQMVQGGEGSMLSSIAGLIAPLFAPLGLGDWKIVTALMSGFMAKESVVASLGVLGGLSVLTRSSAVSMLVFCLLYTPCVAAISTVNRELGGKWACFMVAFQCVVAWIVAFFAYNLALLF